MKKKGLVKENKREKAITFSKNTETKIPKTAQVKKKSSKSKRKAKPLSTE
jgi:hypothetical protein